LHEIERLAPLPDGSHVEIEIASRLERHARRRRTHSARRTEYHEGGVDHRLERHYRATEAIDHVLGTKRAIGYFETNHGQCELTLMIAEVVDPDLAMPLSAASVPIPKFASPCGTFGIVGTLATL
jgi:hypothetical protein